jgi:O-glycosyl hydrolase
VYKNSLLRYSNLSNKKQRIIETSIKKVNKYNKSNHNNYSIEMVLEEDDSEEMVRMQEDVLELLDGQIGGMKHRAYWWVWLNQRVVKNEVTMLEELYEEIPYADIEIESSIEVDADYMNK